MYYFTKIRCENSNKMLDVLQWYKIFSCINRFYCHFSKQWRFELTLVVTILFVEIHDITKVYLLIVLNKMRNDLKPAETSRNHPQTTWNHLKLSETTHIVFLLKKSYFQVGFVLILHPKVFFRQIWSEKLKFSKLTQIWYRRTLLYVNFIFNVCFSKFLSFILFWANFVLKSEVLQLNQNLVQGYTAICLLRFQRLFFHIFCHSYFLEANLVPKLEVFQINWNLVQGYIAICLL